MKVPSMAPVIWPPQAMMARLSQTGAGLWQNSFFSRRSSLPLK
jgi:hypothetical protein